MRFAQRGGTVPADPQQEVSVLTAIEIQHFVTNYAVRVVTLAPTGQYTPSGSNEPTYLVVLEEES